MELGLKGVKELKKKKLPEVLKQLQDMTPSKAQHEIEINLIHSIPETVEFLESGILLDLKRLTDKIFISGSFKMEHDEYIFDSVVRKLKNTLMQGSSQKALFENALRQLAAEAKYEIK